jgi:hypothetical protein
VALLQFLDTALACAVGCTSFHFAEALACLFIFVSVLCQSCRPLGLHTTDGGMKRWGLRATFLSSYTELDAWQNA